MERYEIVKDLGCGNFGVAKLVEDKWSGELYAVKYIERGKKIDEHVQREIMNHRSLKHPNIIRFKEVLLTPTHLGIVMEYAAGGELFDRIRNACRFSEEEARFFFQQLISGVSYCHSMQICHRDLKLENTLLDGSLTPLLKICDFGYSKFLKFDLIRIIQSSVFHSRPKSTVGIPVYIAPEVLSRKEYDGKRITISEIEKHPWFLRNLPLEFIEGKTTSVEVNSEDDYVSQSIEEALAIIQEGRILCQNIKNNNLLLGGSLDLDETDSDEDLDDFDISDDFVCAM